MIDRQIIPPSDPERLQPHADHGSVVTHRFAELLADRRARAEQAARDAERWLDDGGSPDPAPAQAVAVMRVTS